MTTLICEFLKVIKWGSLLKATGVHHPSQKQLDAARLAVITSNQAKGVQSQSAGTPKAQLGSEQ